MLHVTCYKRLHIVWFHYIKYKNMKKLTYTIKVRSCYLCGAGRIWVKTGRGHESASGVLLMFCYTFGFGCWWHRGVLLWNSSSTMCMCALSHKSLCFNKKMEIKEGVIDFQGRGNSISSDTGAWWVHAGIAHRVDREREPGNKKGAEEMYALVGIRFASVPSDWKNLCFYD